MNIIQHRTSKHSPNREPITPFYLVLHDTEGYMPGTLAWLADAPAYKDGKKHAVASVHYLVTRKGEVYQLGYDRWSMWHAGRTYWADRAPGIAASATGNYDMIGIELEHVTEDQGREYPAAQLRALDELIAHIFDHNPTLRGVVGHKDIAYPRGRKVDPQLDVHQYSIAAVRARLGQEVDDMTEEDRRLLRLGRVSDVARSYDVEIIKALVRGDADEAARLESQKDAAVRVERQRLGLV